MLKILTRDDPTLSVRNYIRMPPSSTVSERGYNVLHLNTKNHHFSHNPSATDFVETVLLPNKARSLASDSAVLKYAVEKALNLNETGIFLEFGFCTGTTLNFIAALAYDRLVYGFDSLKGLPETWRPGFPAQVFAYQDETKFPFIPLANVELVIGWIQETLPIFINTILTDKEVAFIHIDSDSNQAAATILDQLNKYIQPDYTVIILDEGYNFSDNTRPDGDNEWIKHEFSAMQSFAKSKGYDIKYLAFNENHQQLAFIFQTH